MTDAAPQRMTIDIYSDVMCPWCLIGYGQLTKALDQLDGEIEAQLRWRPFELNPDMPQQGEEQEAHLQRKYRRSAEEGAAVRGQMNSIADSAGVSLSYEGSGEAPPAMMWNTRAAHKLLTWALEEAGPKVQTDLKLALFKAHFNERRNVSDETVLLDIAASVGLHREAAKAALSDEDLEARVIAEERQAWDLNISGVPAMIVNGKFMIPGAQAPETYVNALRRVAEKSAA
ncbi:DsbA family oxidoreductase [Altererythrobacter sp.]|uniref:DsbA family oxidoreductase n=1 Tax=Altererythrobacter sp. TaxID=1872480 RepID=UPI001B18FB88|nr:DsbA family oxidoreductase [Altererythrobacter sp.]MBO6608674.1 DsbA family oxidoreductase [Altererythrobacter sp.]MBO6642928.1 DsbA family oxidoreductase [Altererythrobacter sp.]MBO6709671.1 DsbA family oxidoreductase [Altererythrobacter sp.]